MPIPDPSLDPNRTLDHDRKPPPDTVDVSQEVSKSATGPYVPALPAETPSIPGYRIHEEIAKGGMGRVYAGHDLTLDREVAIKTLLPGANAERFVTEAKITAKLPHPGIPPVHALGTLDDGTPWLAMKLIHGQTLAELLKQRSSPREDLPRFIQVFEQIAQAVGFAHSRGILHRDLKPLNVMVGEFGEVQVMDWGLAKEMVSPASGRCQPTIAEEQSAHADRSPIYETQAGTILGTPGYMAPEQARGEVVDARADVFALGSILATILTGKPAFVGTSKYETISKAASADLADVLARLDACGADTELLAIARRCLSAQPEDRFADGREVASQVAAYRAAVEARLRQAETAAAEALVREAEQRKRRRLTLVAGGTIAAALLIGLAISLWQMRRAIHAEAFAVKNEQQAIDERDAKDAALKAEKEARERAMAALRVMTDEVIEQQLARTPTLTEENKEFLRKVIQQFEGFAAITADDADSRSIRAEGVQRVGVMRYRLGDLTEAEAAYRDALAKYKQLTADFPTRSEFRQDLASSHNNLGVLLSDTGRLAEAEASYRNALAIRKQLAADFPTRPDVRQELAMSHNNLGVLLRNTGRLAEAEAAYREALALRKQLAADFPTRPDVRQHLGGSHNNLGNLLYQTGRLKEAEAAWRDALALQRQLAADFPTRPDFRQELAMSHNNLGVLLGVTGRLKEAEAAHRDALAIRKQLASDFPTRPDFRQELAGSHNNLGNLLRATGRPKEAEAAHRDALAIRKQLVADFPTRPEFRQELAGSHNNLGNLLRATGRPKEAEAAYREALAMYKQLAAEFPAVPDFPYELAKSHNNLGNLLYQMGRLKEAEAAWHDALKLGQQLATEFPTRPDFRQELATSHNSLGILLCDTGRPKEAEAAYRDALALYKQLAADFPNQPDMRNELAGTLGNLASLCNQQRDFATAKGYLEEAQPHHQATLKANPTHPTYRQFYRNNLMVLAQAHAGLLDQAAAIKTAEQIRDLGWDAAGDAYDAARALALCIPIVEKHEKLDAEQRQAAMQTYGDEAMKLLRDAVAKGYKDIAQIKADKDLDPLRDREDFKKLLGELMATFQSPKDIAPPPPEVKR